MKKMVAGLLATIMITTNVCPMFPVRAASGVASLESLGKLGTVNIGSKSESGTWLQTQVDSKPVFCMDLGKACHTGYTYKSESKTISSDDSSTKNKLEAKIGYWYDQVKKGSNKAWVYAQCLIWSVEEGCTSESNLKSVINQVKKNTGYYKDDSLYSDIFEVSKKVECDIYMWKYSGTTDDSEVQKLLQIKSTDEEFNHVNAKINTMRYSEVEGHNRYKDLVDKCLWGHEADYDLHVLAKINLIMHGDGWNNIYQGDTLSSDKIPDDYFDLILANPPFTIPYSFKDVLDKYELGIGKDSEELDILFVEKSIKALKPGCDLFIVLPEGLLNNKKYLYFRKWLLEKTDLLLSISLPEGAFIPFGGSVSKTCILGLRKKSDSIEYSSPGFVFLGKANEIGYEQGKKSYKQTEKNDLQEFEYMTDEVFEGIKVTSNDGECGWIEHNLITNYRIDANYLLNKIDKKKLEELYKEVIPLAEVCSVVNESVSVRANTIYNYLEVLDISPQTGSITNVRKVSGKEIGDSFHLFYGGDILFTRINPRINRVAIAPPVKPFGIMSKEIYRILYKKNKYISEENRYVICAILQNEWVIKQIIRLSTGSSSSRARVQVEDLLNDVYIPVLDEKVQKEISDSTYSVSKKLWNLSQKILKSYVKNQKILGGDVDKDQLRGI